MAVDARIPRRTTALFGTPHRGAKVKKTRLHVCPTTLWSKVKDGARWGYMQYVNKGAFRGRSFLRFEAQG